MNRLPLKTFYPPATLCKHCGAHVPRPCLPGDWQACPNVRAGRADQANVRTQREIVADLLRRAELIETSARTAKHTKANKITLHVAARILRVAALQNSPGYIGPNDDTADELTVD